MKPYYEEDGIVIYHADCREVLPGLATTDLILADPPYGIGYVHGAEPNDPNESKVNCTPIIGDDEPFNPSHLFGFKKVILWGGNHYADKLPSSGGWLIWDKRCGTGSNDHSDCEIAWTNSSRSRNSEKFN